MKLIQATALYTVLKMNTERGTVVGKQRDLFIVPRQKFLITLYWKRRKLLMKLGPFCFYLLLLACTLHRFGSRFTPFLHAIYAFLTFITLFMVGSMNKEKRILINLLKVSWKITLGMHLIVINAFRIKLEKIITTSFTML